MIVAAGIGVEAAVCSGEVNVAAGVDGGRRAALPEGTAAAMICWAIYDVRPLGPVALD